MQNVMIQKKNDVAEIRNNINEAHAQIDALKETEKFMKVRFNCRWNRVDFYKFFILPTKVITT